MDGEEPDEFDRLACSPGTGPRSHCPAIEKLALLGAGLAADNQRDVLAHVIGCDACWAMVRDLAEDFADERTEAETRMLESLQSSTTEWQATMARRMAVEARR